MSNQIVLFLCGDVMTGRGIDQVLPKPGNPVIYESYIKDARKYVKIAEQVNGPIPQPVPYEYIWGHVLQVFDEIKPDAKIINLETSITTNPEYWPGKGIQYRMNPENIRVLNAAGIDCCTLANNHILDWSYEGLDETIESLQKVGIKASGAGKNIAEASKPAILPIGHNHRILVFSYGFPDSGVPKSWAATPDRPGINLLPDFSSSSLERVTTNIKACKCPGDVVVCSMHWGHNWGYEIPSDHRNFAHHLIHEAGVDLIHGHSSHHVKGIEIYDQKLILYGCGDFITDYEGISGYESFRDDLGLMYFPTLNPLNGKLEDLVLVPTKIERFSVHKAQGADFRWLLNVVNRESNEMNARFIESGGTIKLVKG
jgi:poly-gamma-glutamate capsule biosynthesis protein CapA/YwtB (metallophosphatase superfamily)